MKLHIIKALEKKIKFKQIKSDDSEDILTSDDEEEVSKSVIYKWYNNRYFSIKYLGRGTFCRVWLVYDIIDDTFYAMKIYFPNYYEDSLHELKMCNLIKTNNNIVKMYDNFLLDKSNILIYELMGLTLLDVMDLYDNSIPINNVKKITLNILKGLSELHSNKIIHCDLKPENIMFKQLKPNINNILNVLQNINLKSMYEKMILDSLSDDYNIFDKCKKKNIKRKIKVKCLSVLGNIIKLELEQHLYYDDDVLLFDENSACKIIDLGNSDIIGDTNIDEINIRCYRPPENIMNEFYNEKADIWALGCILYELFANDYLFYTQNNISNIEQNRSHLSDIFKIVGYPSKTERLNCDFFKDLFDIKGNIINYHESNETICLKESFTELYKNELDYIDEFIKKLLDVNVITRWSAKKLLNDTWINS